MGLPSKTGTIVRTLANADFSAHTYFKVYTSSDTDVTINSGSTMTLKTGTVLDIAVQSISATSDTTVFLIGSPNFFDFSGPYNITSGQPL